MPSPSIAIIGGGPAGAAAAITLARAGIPVTVFESKSFPRRKVCGEFISPAATRILESLLSSTELRAAGAQRVRELVIEEGDREATWRMPDPAWVLSRAALDTLLLGRACEAGASILQPCTVREVRYHDEGADLALADGTILTAELVIHADGVGRHDPNGPTPARRGVLARKCHLKAAHEGGPPPHLIRGLHMRAAAGCYVGMVGIEHGRTTLALVARTSLIARHKGDADSMLAELWPAWRAEWRDSDWLACPVPGSGYIAPGHPRSFRIGNAAAAVEPVGGEGIGLAIWSGVTLGQLLIRAFRPEGAPECRHGRSPPKADQPVESRKATVPAPAGAEEISDHIFTPICDESLVPLTDLLSLHSRFSRLYRRRLLFRRPVCRAAAEVLMRPRIVRALWPLLATRAVREIVLGPWYALTGK